MIYILEERPPQIEAVQFNGANAAEVAELANVSVPDIEQGDAGLYIMLAVDRGSMGTMSVPVNDTDWVFMSFGFPSVMNDATKQAQYRQVS